MVHHVHGGDPVEPSRPLSQTWLATSVFIPPDAATGDISVPTIIDSIDEPDEWIELQVYNPSAGPVPEVVLTGVVTNG
ncbi:hypothetical protein GCM10029963_10490 [Micromonospora andamanensis]